MDAALLPQSGAALLAPPEFRSHLAGSHRWPTRVMDGRHLHFLHEPAAVAELVLGLAPELARR